MSLLSAALKRNSVRVENMLDRLLTDRDTPQRLTDAMRYGVLGGGKRLRPFLLYETAALFGVKADKASRAAAALELIHCYSLVHDDLPSMDNDDMRRGLPTVHKAYDEATAILAGDALLTLAFEVMAAPATHADGAVRAAMVAELAQAAGRAGMVGGQLLDLAGEGRFGNDEALRPRGEAAIRRMQSLKTGALIRCAVSLGCHLGGADAEARARLERYGGIVGLAFQIADDLIDLQGTAQEAGKAVGKDAVLGKATLPGLFGVEWALAELVRLIEEAHGLLEPFGPKALLLKLLPEHIAFRKM